MHRRMTFMISLLIISIVIISSLMTISEIRRLNYEDAKTRLSVTAKLIAGNLERLQTHEFDYDRYIQESARLSGVRVTVISPSGMVLGDSDARAVEMDSHYYREEVQMAYTGRTGFSQRYSSTINKQMLYVAHPLLNPDGTTSVVRVALAVKSLNDLFWQESSKIIGISLAGILTAIVISRRFVRRILEPIRNLSAASAKIAEGQYGLTLMEANRDEIGELTRSFNVMSERLLLNTEESKAGAVKTQAILSSMINGIVAVDNDRRVMFINPVAEVLLGIREEQVRGHHVMEVIRSNRLDECLEQFMTADQRASADIEIYEPVFRILSIATTPILSEQQQKLGAVVMLTDVTDIRKLEQMRKDFVANVSHELKTPLTSIQGFVETLKAGAAEQREVRDKFLDILDIESARLSVLIDDLLMLSDIENRTRYGAKDEIPVIRSVREVVEMLSDMAQRKGVLLTLDTPPELPALLGNPGWFKQMIINLVDNAIKYTPEGGAVHVLLKLSEDQVEISVSDTGIGIEEEHLPRLFERFYRVDKARSREVGGTGLGLAIVKHIVLAMEGQIAVNSIPGEGTTFAVHFPVSRRV